MANGGATIPTSHVVVADLSGATTPDAETILHRRLQALSQHAELAKVFWRKCDSTEWLHRAVAASNCNNNSGANTFVDALVAQLQQTFAAYTRDSAQFRGTTTINFTQLDGTCHSIPVDRMFYKYVDEKGGGLQACLTTVRDIKVKIEETCGVAASEQALYLQELEECHDECACLDDDATLDEIQLCDGQTVTLVADPTRPYWTKHGALAKAYHAICVRGYKALKAVLQKVQQSENSIAPLKRQKIRRLMVSCCKTINFLKQKPSTHKTLPMAVLDRVERHLLNTGPLLQRLIAHGSL